MKKGFWNQWKKCFLSLRPNGLLIYKRSKKGTDKGRFATLIVSIPMYSLTVRDSPTNLKKKGAFDIFCGNHGDGHYILASEDKNEWITKITIAIREFTENKQQRKEKQQEVDMQLLDLAKKFKRQQERTYVPISTKLVFDESPGKIQTEPKDPSYLTVDERRKSLGRQNSLSFTRSETLELMEELQKQVNHEESQKKIRARTMLPSKVNPLSSQLNLSNHHYPVAGTSIIPRPTPRGPPPRPPTARKPAISGEITVNANQNETIGVTSPGQAFKSTVLPGTAIKVRESPLQGGMVSPGSRVGASVPPPRKETNGQHSPVKASPLNQSYTQRDERHLMPAPLPPGRQMGDSPSTIPIEELDGRSQIKMRLLQNSAPRPSGSSLARRNILRRRSQSLLNVSELSNQQSASNQIFPRKGTVPVPPRNAVARSHSDDAQPQNPSPLAQNTQPPSPEPNRHNKPPTQNDHQRDREFYTTNAPSAIRTCSEGQTASYIRRPNGRQAAPPHVPTRRRPPASSKFSKDNLKPLPALPKTLILQQN